MGPRLRVIDIETTGEAPPAEIIEFGRVDVVRTGHAWVVERPMARLYRPLGPIPPETMAVHHITEADFTPDTSVCTPERLQQAIRGGERPDVLVAHNCAFERLFLEAALPASLPWICTYKVALHVWPEAPRHSNQVLRYWRNLRLDSALAMPPHRAGPDAYVTAHLLTKLLGSASVERRADGAMDQPAEAPAHPAVRQAPRPALAGGAAGLPAMDGTADGHGCRRDLVCAAGGGAARHISGSPARQPESGSRLTTDDNALAGTRLGSARLSEQQPGAATMRQVSPPGQDRLR